MHAAPLRLGGACVLAVLLAACATRPTAPPSGFAQLRGWAEEDHRAAVRAFRDGCGAARDEPTQTVCARARAFDQPDAVSARRFLEANFRPAPTAGEGLLTAYFTPDYEARTRPEGEFVVPVRPAPTIANGEAYPERAVIETWPAVAALAWMRAEDLFFMQLQGSAVLWFPDGRRTKAVTVTTNGRPFVGVARVLRERGLLADGQTSGENIQAWLAANRGPRADEVMRQNPRYGFFALQPFDGAISGAAGVPLGAARAIAIDPAHHAYGSLYWVDAEAPALAGAVPAYRRAAVALDTGGAITGEVRADLYLGQGAEAGREAGRVRHRLRLYRLVPVP